MITALVALASKFCKIWPLFLRISNCGTKINSNNEKWNVKSSKRCFIFELNNWHIYITIFNPLTILPHLHKILLLKTTTFTGVHKHDLCFAKDQRINNCTKATFLLKCGSVLYWFLLIDANVNNYRALYRIFDCILSLFSSILQFVIKCPLC